MGRVYAVTFDQVAVSAAQDLFEITPAANKPIKIIGLFLGQSSDEGDAAAELLPISVIRGNATSGSGGSTVTPTPLTPTDVAASFTAEANNTTIASTGSPVTLHADAWNVQSGYPLMLPDQLKWPCTAGQTRIVVRVTAPADAITMSGTLYVEEEG